MELSGSDLGVEMRKSCARGRKFRHSSGRIKYALLRVIHTSVFAEHVACVFDFFWVQI